jgi:eukaryotic-like serine/threonine-protein kinase
VSPRSEFDTNDELMMSIANAIAEGTAVDWDEEEQRTAGHDVDVLRSLRSVECIVTAHRQLARTWSEESTHARPAGREAPLTNWAHLTIVEKIDEGAFGGVYRAHDDRLATDVALKLMWTDPAAGAMNTAHVLKEARLLAKVRHPNVVKVLGADETQQRVGLWMEFIKGRTLEDLLRTHGLFGAREAALIGTDVCRAVAAVHNAGLLHGDIKARNVMREEGGRTVLMDFGASHEVTAHAPSGDQLSGTPVYLAPEVLDDQPPSKAADIYAIGVLLFHLVTDRYPVYGHTWTGVIDGHHRGERLRLRDARPDLPEEFVRIVERATASDPRHRYESAGGLEEALSRFHDPTTGSPRSSWSKRTVILASLGAAIAIAGGLWWLGPTGSRVSRSKPAITRTAPEPLTAPTSGSSSTYEIDAAFYKVRDRGRERLDAGSRVTVGDRLQFDYQATIPTHVYIVNEPDQGTPYLLFPLPDRRPANPLPANTAIRLPADFFWQVTRPGGREHFVVFASPERVEAFEEAFAALPQPRIGEPPLRSRSCAVSEDSFRSHQPAATAYASRRCSQRR